MSRETSNLGLILYDPSEDKDVKVRDVINKVLGFTDSNTIKIDAKTKDIDTNIKTLHDSIIGTDGNVVFYNKQEVFLAVHPVGSIFLSTNRTEPAELYGGTWEQIKDCIIWGASDAHPVGTKLDAGLPNITGEFIAALRDGFTRESNTRITGAFYENGTTTGEDGYNSVSTNVGIPSGMAPFGFDASRSNSIYGASDTVQPPVYCTYIWKRIE